MVVYFRSPFYLERITHMATQIITVEQTEEALGLSYSEEQKKMLETRLPRDREVIRRIDRVEGILVPGPPRKMSLQEFIPPGKHDWCSSEGFTQDQELLVPAKWFVFRRPALLGFNEHAQFSRIEGGAKVLNILETAYSARVYRKVFRAPLLDGGMARTSTKTSINEHCVLFSESKRGDAQINQSSYKGAQRPDLGISLGIEEF